MTSKELYVKVVSVISKPPEQRNETDIDELLQWFVAKCDLFKTLPDEVVKDIIKNCSFEKHRSNAVIIKQGEKGNSFYILLTGTVSVHINTSLSEVEDDETAAQMPPTTVIDIKKKVEYASNREPYGNCVSNLSAGAGFGELALISKNCIRNASIIADESIDLLVVDRTLYNRSLRKPQEQEFRERVQFVSEFPYFANWMHRHKNQMAMSMQRVTLPYDSHIVKQGEKVQGLYFLLKGEAKILVNPVAHQNQFANHYPLDIENGDSSDDDDQQLLPKMIHNRNLDLCIIAPFEVVGELELVTDLPCNTNSVKCRGDVCEVYFVNTRNCERLILKRYAKSMNPIRENALLRLRTRIARFPFGFIPFYTYLAKQLQHLINPVKPIAAAKDDAETLRSLDYFNRRPPRGVLIDMYGPGSAFFHIRRDNKIRKRNDEHNNATLKEARDTLIGKERPSMILQQVLNEMENEDFNDTTFGGQKVMSSSRMSSSGSEEEEEPDWETSDQCLSQLEIRMKNFLKRASAKPSATTSPKAGS